MNSSRIFRMYDLRGVFNKDFDEEFAYKLGRAFCAYLNKKNIPLMISVGRDMRASSDILHKRLVEGLLDSKASVFDLGQVPTPLNYFSNCHYPFIEASIMITASHNPPEHNGFKLNLKKTPFFGEQIQELKDIFNSQENTSSKDKGTYKKISVINDYIAYCKSQFTDFKNIPVIIDCGNGASGWIVRELYSALGLNPKIIYEKPDGTFPNHPCDPSVEKNLNELIKLCKKEKTIGLSFDGDGDRVGLVDEEGNFRQADEILSVISSSILKENSNKKMIFDIKSSENLFNIARKEGGEVLMCPSGHSPLRKKVLEENAILGGEFSGHIIFNDKHYGFDDGPYTGLRLLEILQKENKKFCELFHWPVTHSTPEIRIPVEEQLRNDILNSIENSFTSDNQYEVKKLDGLRIYFKSAWALVRGSHTESALVLRFEGTKKEDFDFLKNKIVSSIKLENLDKYIN